MQVSDPECGLSSESDIYVREVLSQLPAKEERLEEIKVSQRINPICNKEIEFCKSGWPVRKCLSPELKKFVSTGDLRHGSRLFSVVSKMNFGESELHNRRSYGF